MSGRIYDHIVYMIPRYKGNDIHCTYTFSVVVVVVDGPIPSSLDKNILFKYEYR